jgi:outer membrane protein assembly factor BamB
VFVRQSYQEGGQVLCFNAADGNLKWPARQFPSRPDDGRLVSDPLMIGDSLGVLTVFDQTDGTLDLRLMVLDPTNGEVRRRHSLLRLRPRDHWRGDRALARVSCDAVAAQDQIIATVGGCVVCLDLSGQARWARKQTLLPHTLLDVAASSLAQPQEAPLVIGDRVYVSQRDVRSIECLDLHTGRLHWRYVSPDVRRVAGISGEIAVVETAEGFVGLSAASGEVRWHRQIERLLEGRLCGAADGTAGQFIYARRDVLVGGQSRPSLVWLDLQTGRDVAVLPLPELAGREAVVGPLLAKGNRTWLFAGDNSLDTKRRLWELVPRGPRLPRANEETAMQFYLPDAPPGMDASLRSDVSAAVGWTLLASQSDPRVGWQTKWQNEPDVALTLAIPGRPVRLLRQVTVPAQGPAKLAIGVGHESGERWELEITAGGKSLLRSEVSPKTASGGWLRRELDLSAFAGQTLWLTAIGTALDGKPAHPAWRQLEPTGDRGAAAP